MGEKWRLPMLLKMLVVILTLLLEYIVSNLEQVYELIFLICSIKATGSA